MNDPIQHVLDLLAKQQAPSASAQRAPELLRNARRICDRDGHLYQVAGRMSPTRVQCSRCRCTWAIGPKTEPAG